MVRTSTNCLGLPTKVLFLKHVGHASQKTNPSLSLCFNRKEVKDHGEGGMFIGQSPSGNVVVVDDVLSAGTAAKESIDLILENDATPSGILVGLIDRKKVHQLNLQALS